MAFTDKLYEGVEFKDTLEKVDLAGFKSRYYEAFGKSLFPEIYHGFYDQNFPLDLDIDALASKGRGDLQLQEIFDQEKIQQVLENNFIYNDKSILEQIGQGAIDVKTFDYDGKKYQKKEAAKVLLMVEEEVKAQEKNYQEIDDLAMTYFAGIAKRQGCLEEYKTKYEETVDGIKQLEKDYEIFQKIMGELSPAFQDEVQFDVAKRINTQVKALEPELKTRIKELTEDERVASSLTQKDRELFSQYLSKKRDYYVPNKFIDKNIELLITTLNRFLEVSGECAVQIKRTFLEFQLTMSNRDQSS